MFAVVCALASVALLFVLARRTGLSRIAAGAACVGFVASPLALGFLRHIYLDTIALPWLLAAFALAAGRRRSLGSFVASGACAAVAVLSKETFALALPALFVHAWVFTERRTRAFHLTGAIAAFTLVVAGYPLFATLKGELLPGPHHVSLWDAIRFQLVGRSGSGSLLEPGTPAHHILTGWLATDHWLLAAGAAAAVAALAVRRLRGPAVAVLVLAVAALRPGYLPEMYVVALLPFAALCVAGVFDAAVRWRPRRWRMLHGVRLVAAAAAVALVAAAAPVWATRDRGILHSNANEPQVHAERWIKAHVPRRDRILVDDTYYVDLVRAGFRQRYGVVWFSKLDNSNGYDRSVRRALPGGWRDLDYVVVSPSMRTALRFSPAPSLGEIRAAIRHGTLQARFGHGADRVDILHLAHRGGAR